MSTRPEPHAGNMAILPRSTYVIDAVVRLEHAISTIGNLRLQPWNISLPTYAAMRILALRPDLSLAQLSRRCYVQPQTMTRIITQLERRGLATKAKHPENESAIAIRLTDAGQAALQAMHVEVDQVNATLSRALSDSELDALDQTLRECAHLIEADIKALRGRRE